VSFRGLEAIYLSLRDALFNVLLYSALNLLATALCLRIFARIALTLGLRCSLAIKFPLRTFFFFFAIRIIPYVFGLVQYRERFQVCSFKYNNYKRPDIFNIIDLFS
jgi:hypothetical protein